MKSHNQNRVSSGLVWQFVYLGIIGKFERANEVQMG